MVSKEFGISSADGPRDGMIEIDLVESRHDRFQRDKETSQEDLRLPLYGTIGPRIEEKE